MTAEPITLAPDMTPTLLREPGRLESLVGPESYRLLRGLFRNPLSITGMIILLAFFSVAAFAPVLAPPVRANANPYLIPRDGFSPEPKPPGTLWTRNPPKVVPRWYTAISGNEEWHHIMGTTSGQFDIWYGIVWGTRTAIFVGVAVVAASLVIGLLMGSISAFYGGAVDDVLMRVTEIFMAFPFLLAALMLTSLLVPLFGRGIWPAMIALIVFGWMGYSRVLRSEVLTVKQRDYVLAARTIGAKDTRLLLRHVLPNAVFSTLVLASLDVGAVVLSFAALSFLGVGTDIGYADWGQLISFARDYILSLDDFWFIVVFPGAALILFGLAWNLIGDALRDILDPRMKGARGT